jgi:hypothetical protein
MQTGRLAPTEAAVNEQRRLPHSPTARPGPPVAPVAFHRVDARRKLDGCSGDLVRRDRIVPGSAASMSRNGTGQELSGAYSRIPMRPFSHVVIRRSTRADDRRVRPTMGIVPAYRRHDVLRSVEKAGIPPHPCLTGTARTGTLRHHAHPIRGARRPGCSGPGPLVRAVSARMRVPALFARVGVNGVCVMREADLKPKPPPRCADVQACSRLRGTPRTPSGSCARFPSRQGISVTTSAMRWYSATLR